MTSHSSRPRASSPVGTLDRLAPQLLALDAGALVPLNAEPTRVLLVVLGALPRLRVLRPLLVETFGEAASCLDRLEPIAWALSEAHARSLVTTAPDEVPRLAGQALDARRLLLSEIRALSARKVVRARELPVLRGGNAPRSVAFDLLDLAQFLRARWPALQPHTRLPHTELDRAEALVDHLLEALGRRAHPLPSAAADLRARAYTLLLQTYDEVRRMVAFVRWREGDATDLVPGWTRPVRTARRGARQAADGAGSFSRAGGNARGGLTTPGPTPVTTTDTEG